MFNKPESLLHWALSADWAPPWCICQGTASSRRPSPARPAGTRWRWSWTASASVSRGFQARPPCRSPPQNPRVLLKAVFGIKQQSKYINLLFMTHIYFPIKDQTKKPLELQSLTQLFIYLNVLIGWRPGYHERKILSTCFLDRKTIWRTRYVMQQKHSTKYGYIIQVDLRWPVTNLVYNLSMYIVYHIKCQTIHK